MKLTITNATVILAKHLGVEVELVNDDESPARSLSNWIVNTKTSSGAPEDLHPKAIIEVVLSDGKCQPGFVAMWDSMWNTKHMIHITKYRVVN